MPASDPKLIAALVSARAALDSALMALTQEESAAAPETAQTTVREAAEEVPCKHKRRTEIAKTFGITEHWVCDDCGYEYRR